MYIGKTKRLLESICIKANVDLLEVKSFVELIITLILLKGGDRVGRFTYIDTG